MSERRESTRGTRPLLEIGRIFHEPAVAEYERGREILTRFPDVERIEVASPLEHKKPAWQRGPRPRLGQDKTGRPHPGLQKKKVSENGAANVRYARQKKGKMVKLFKGMLAESLPYCKVRYAF